MLTNLSPKGRGGGAAILYPTTWTHVHSWTWSSRFLFVRLQDPDGIELSLAVCHFHHDATIRAHQWKKLASLRHLIPSDTIFLPDHNSVILPSRDVSSLRTSPEQKDVLEARECEISFLAEHDLVDAFAALHSCRTEDFPLEGCTWGFPCLCPKDAPPPVVSQHEADMTDISTDRRRRIDRVLVPHNFVSVLRECYPCFLASSDHKAVVFFALICLLRLAASQKMSCLLSAIPRDCRRHTGTTLQFANYRFRSMGGLPGSDPPTSPRI